MLQSQLFTKTLKEAPKDESSINSRLLIRAGFIDKVGSGIYTLLPLGVRVLSRIEQIVREEINAVGGQELLMPSLHPIEYWEATGRWNELDILFKLVGHEKKEYALGATHEEIITPLAHKFILSYKDLPKAVYQIQTKFRNEPRAKSGLLRGREFRMKDLYSFHSSQEDLNEYYDTVTSAYHKIYNRCGLGDKTLLTYSSGGTFSKYSHEFQTLASQGEDTIFVCQDCSVGVNNEILKDLGEKCPSCGNALLNDMKATEVGNIFKLGTKYSTTAGLSFTDEHGEINDVIMGCYGIGTTRIMGTIVEIFNDENGIIWPKEIAPYDIHLITIGSDSSAKNLSEQLYNQLVEHGHDVLFDDRELRPGEKFADSDLIGIPIRIVISDKTIKNKQVEIKKRNELEAQFVDQQQVLSELKKL